MTYEELQNTNFAYFPISVHERMPDKMKFVPVIDDVGEISIYRHTEHGWNMRDGMADNSPNNNRSILYWLEKKPILDEQTTASLSKIIKPKELKTISKDRIIEIKYGGVILSDEEVKVGYGLQYKKQLTYINEIAKIELYPIRYFFMNSIKEHDFGTSASTYNDGRMQNIIGTVDILKNGFKLNGVEQFKTE